ncbi:MAG: ArsR/SmtB family transcription factor [Candidatus Hinthialibacter sp.]
MKENLSTDWDPIVIYLKAMAHPVRLTILQNLLNGPQCVQEVHQIINLSQPNLSQPNLSQHLSILKKAGLVDCHYHGTLRCYYLLRKPLVSRLMKEFTRDHPQKPRKREDVIRKGKRKKNDRHSVDAK